MERPFLTAGGGGSAALAVELDGLRRQVEQLRAENARLLRLLELTPGQARPPGPVHAGSSPAEKVRFFGTLFAARTDVYATRWERCRRAGATVFLDVGTLEPYEDQWAYLSSLNRLSPREVGRLAASVGGVSVGVSVNRLAVPTSTRTRPSPPPIVHARLGASITVAGGDLTP